jgi:hypothetical protein
MPHGPAGHNPIPMLVFESKALDLAGLLPRANGLWRATALSTKQEDKAVDNGRILNQIKRFDHWLFCVQRRSTRACAKTNTRARLPPPSPARRSSALPKIGTARRASSRKQPESCRHRRTARTPVERPNYRPPDSARVSLSSRISFRLCSGNHVPLV